ncbi:MAG: efflux RND transporter periplasmic adaptor subunit [candidate division Zixibacteria bacterium]|nr:efflux RND transporter periplasmic adaptor subunit [candidate division Zixibacteria bacterium]
MKKTTKILVPVIILVVGLGAMLLFASMKTEPERRASKPRPMNVEVIVAQLGDVPAEIIAYGRVTTAQPVELYAEVTGELIRGDVPFQPAQSFKKGDLLLQIDERQTQLTLNSTKSDLMTALATVLPEIKVDFPDEYQVWQDYFNNCGFNGNLEPLPETSNQKIKLFLSRFNVYKLYFSVRDLEITLAKHYFYAPFDGSIVSASLREGSSARPGSHLGEIINLEDMEVEVSVSAEDIGWISLNQKVVLTSAELSGPWEGTITRIGSSIDDRTQTIPLYISVDNNEASSLLNGIFVEARIPGRVTQNSVAVPRKALYNENYVYLIKEGKLKYTEVAVARKETNSVIVDSGIAQGDTLVVGAMQGVSAGMPAVARQASASERSK